MSAKSIYCDENMHKCEGDTDSHEYMKDMQKIGPQFLARRLTTEFLSSHIVVLGYGELVAEIEDNKSLRVIRWKLGDGVHTWDELPDIPGPQYACCIFREVLIIPR